MAENKTFDRDETTGKWSSDITQTAKTKTYTIATEEKYVDKNIELKITAQDAELESTPSSTNCTLSNEDKTSGIAVKCNGGVTKSGWIDTTSTTMQYITDVTLARSKTLKLNDGIYNWTITTDSSGNVSIS